MMQTMDNEYATPPPDQATLIAAQTNAANVKSKKVTFPEELEERSYGGVDRESLPKSSELTKAAQEIDDDETLTYFDNDLTAAFYRSSLRPTKRMDDPTIPTTVKAQQLHVKLLVKAFKSIRNCDDNEGMVKPFRERRHDPKLVECICWNLVKACILRSRSDEPLLTAYEPHKAKNSVGIDNFAARFDQVAYGMSRSKTVCKHLFDAPFINGYVDDPVRSIRRVESNRSLNKLKADVMAKGKAVTKVVNGATVAKKTRAGTRKRSAETAGMDDFHGSPMHTPPSTATLPPRLTQSAPGGRVTRRMSRMMANNQVNESSPLPTPSTLHGDMPSSPLSPLSTITEVKDENSPLPQDNYNMNGYHEMSPMGAMPNGYNNGSPLGMNFPGTQRYMGFSYGNGVPFYPFGSNNMNYMISPTGHGPTHGMYARRAPMAPEEVDMPAQVSSMYPRPQRLLTIS